MNLKQKYIKQQGVVLVLALIVLLMITVITLTSMRGVTLESSITTAHKRTNDLRDSAEGALREAEFRFYGPGYVREKTEPVSETCDLNNVLRPRNLNRPCMLNIKEDKLQEFVANPASLHSGDDNDNTAEFIDGTRHNDFIAWMPFRGLDPAATTNQPAIFAASWNSMMITVSEDENESINPEYGNVLEGRGTYFYLINARTDNGEYVLQSTIANTYLGINN